MTHGRTGSGRKLEAGQSGVQGASHPSHAEKAQAAARYGALLEAIPDMMFRISREGVYLEYIPAKGLDPFVPPSEFLGKTMHDIMPEPVADEGLHYVQVALETGEAQVFEYQLPFGDSLRDYEARTVVSGRDEVLIIVRDITMRRQADAEVEKLRHDFLSMVTQELKTPLTAIKGSAVMALEGRRPRNDEELRGHFQIISEQSDQLRDLVDNLLDMCRIESGALLVHPIPADLRGVLEDAKTKFSRAGGASPVQIDVPDNLEQVKADPARVAQVLTNLLDNAAKFSPTNAPISLSATPYPTHVAVHVSDQGSGIPKEQLPHLFERFSQGRSDGGSVSGGLGLAVCRGIVEAHGGRIWVERGDSGHGATITFTLPLAPDATTSRPDPSRRAAHLGSVSRGDERTRVLAVDDEPQVRRSLERCLGDGGYQATVTGNPSDALALVEEAEPDLILLDVKLTGTSGFDLLRQIRESSGVPVIFLSASSREDDTVRALRMGADDYIVKPFSPSELLARIEAALRRRVMPDMIEARAPFVLGDLAINFGERRVTLGGNPVPLSATEYKLLYELATHAGRILTHGQISQHVWGIDSPGSTDLVRSFIRNLRRKLADEARSPRYILTERQVGYWMPGAGAEADGAKAEGAGGR